MSNATDVRAWAREKGIDIKGHGRIPADVQADYDAQHDPPADLEVTVPDGPDDYAGSVTAADFPPDLPAADEPPAPAPAVPETAPRRPRAPRPGPRAFSGLLSRTRKPAPHKKKGPALPRVSLAGIIEDLWAQGAWFAQGLPPMQKLLQAQAPYAGIVLDDAFKGTFLDPPLQVLARGQEKAKEVGGLVCPPAFLMGVLVTAPEPREITTPEGTTVLMPGEPSVQHKASLLGLRWSLMLMAEAGAMHLDEYAAKVAATEARGRQADEYMAYILGMELPPGEGPAREEEEAVRRAQELFGGAPPAG